MTPVSRAGPVDGSELQTMPRSLLARVARELMLAAHLQDRASVPALLSRHSMAEANDVAIEEWMTTSPVYTARMQRLMRIRGDDVGTILRGLQLEIGMPHQFLDAGYELRDPRHGEFWLTSCGALADVQPLGADMVRGMCHDIEDPTFDATAAATNRRAWVRPVHRPPAIPDGGPVCHWEVTIDDAREPVADNPHLAATAASLLASWPNDPPPSAEDGGWEDYDRPFDPGFELEDLSQRALVLVATEFSLQGHLLARSMMAAVERRWGVDEAIDVGRKLFGGVGWIAAERLVGLLDLDDSLASIAAVLRTCHLTLIRDYLGLSIAGPADDELVVTLAADAPALAETDAFSLSGLLDLGADEILASIAGGVNARARVTPLPTDPASDVRAAWRVTIDRGGEPAREPKAVEIVRFSTGPTTVFIRRRPVRR